MLFQDGLIVMPVTSMEEKFRIAVFCGGPFAFPSIAMLAFEKYLCGIVLSSMDSTIVYNMEKQCEQAGIPLLIVENSSEAVMIENWLDEMKPNAVFSICFPHLISSSTLSAHSIPFINFHTGPLPEFRGPMPIFEVLRRAKKETALTAHFMDEAYDSGNIIYAETIAIQDQDTFTTIAAKLSERCGIMVQNVAQMLEFSSVIPSTSQNTKDAHFYPFPSREELVVDWDNQTAKTIIALIKACDGWNNGAVTYFNGQEIHLFKVEPFSVRKTIAQKPGTISSYSDDGTFSVMCADGEMVRILQTGNETGMYTHLFLQELGIKNNTIFSSLANSTIVDSSTKLQHNPII